MIVSQETSTTFAQEVADSSFLPQTVYLHTEEDTQFYNHTNALYAFDNYAQVSVITVLPANWWA